MPSCKRIEFHAMQSLEKLLQMLDALQRHTALVARWEALNMLSEHLEILIGQADLTVNGHQMLLFAGAGSMSSSSSQVSSREGGALDSPASSS